MVKQLKQIEQDLARLEKKIVGLAEELQGIYRKYLALLGESLQRQLVLASYQVCTQAYPEAFLQLSVDQRQELQQSIQQTAKQTQANLLALLEVSPPLFTLSRRRKRRARRRMILKRRQSTFKLIFPTS